MKGFAVILGSQTFTSPGTFTVPRGFRAIIAAVAPGSPGSPGSTGGSVCWVNGCAGGMTPGNPGCPGGGGSPSYFNSQSSQTYQRSASGLKPRAGIAVVVGGGGPGGPGGAGASAYCSNLGYPVNGTPGPPGSPGPGGSVVVNVT